MELDVDGSGSIEAAELLPLVAPMALASGLVLADPAAWAETFLEIFDADGDGALQLGEYVAFLRFLVVSKAALDGGVNMGEVCAEGEFKMMMGRKDVDNWVESLKLLKAIKLERLEAAAPEAVLRDAAAKAAELFAELDRDRSGTLEAPELHTVLLKLLLEDRPPWAVTPEHARAVAAAFDAHGGGGAELNQAEFGQLYRFLVLVGTDAEAESA